MTRIVLVGGFGTALQLAGWPHKAATRFTATYPAREWRCERLNSIHFSFKTYHSRSIDESRIPISVYC
jgi:hypothetical protein